MTSDLLEEAVKNKVLGSVHLSRQDSVNEFQFPIMPKAMIVQQTKEYHLWKFAQWGKKREQQQKALLVFSVDRNIYRGEELLAEEPNSEEKEWAMFRLSNRSTWPKVCENKIGDYKNWH